MIFMHSYIKYFIPKKFAYLPTLKNIETFPEDIYFFGLIQDSTHSLCFCGDIWKIIIKYPPYLFLCLRYSVDGEQKYLSEVQELIRPERNTLAVSFEDVEKYNQQLATTILEEYYR